MTTPKTIEEYEVWIAKVGYVRALAQLAHIIDTQLFPQQANPIPDHPELALAKAALATVAEQPYVSLAPPALPDPVTQTT